MVDGPADWVDGGSSSKLTVPKINPEDSIAGEWVKVDMVREVSYDIFFHHSGPDVFLFFTTNCQGTSMISVYVLLYV